MSEPMDDINPPCRDALEFIWRDVILAHKPNYGGWEYPGYAYRHIKAEFDDLRAQLRAAEEREGKLRAALGRIRTEGGKVCAEYETCTHRSCSSSYASWAIADAALASAPTQVEGITDTERLDKLETLLNEEYYHNDVLLQSDYEDGVWVSLRDKGVHGLVHKTQDGHAKTLREALDKLPKAKEKAGV